MMKEYFEIEASKATPQYRFRKGLKLFGDKGYQATKNKLKDNLLERGCIDMMSLNNLTWDIRKKGVRISHVPQEKIKRKDKSERIC